MRYRLKELTCKDCRHCKRCPERRGICKDFIAMDRQSGQSVQNRNKRGGVNEQINNR